jgi:hypothetical protein
MEQKKKRRKDMLHRLKVHGLPTANEIKADLRLFEMAEDLALEVYMREQMFPGVEMYSADQVAAADAAIAALSPEEREATLKAARAASEKEQLGLTDSDGSQL